MQYSQVHSCSRRHEGSSSHRKEGGCEPSSLNIRGGIFGFPMVVLPIFRSMAFSSCPLLDDVQRI